MKIFGTIFPFIETDDQTYKYGRYVANYEFLKALITNGNFDEFHIFCLSVSHFNITRNKLISEDILPSQKEKIRLFLYNNLLEKIETTEYHIFHLGGRGYFFPGLVYLRNSHAKNKFPVTGLIHSLNGIETNYHALKICTSPVLPYDTIICSSKAGKKVLENIFQNLADKFYANNFILSFKGGTEIIPLGIGKEFLNIPKKHDSRERLSIPKEAIVILSLGRLSPQAKFDLYPIIKTFKLLKIDNPDKQLLLVIAGGATKSQTRIVKQMISELDLDDSVMLIVNFSHDIKLSIYSAADIYISLSDNLQETFGISVVEAMAAGLPAVVSDINGYKELIKDGENGFKVPTIWTDRFDMTRLADIMNFETMQLMLAQCMAVDTEKLLQYLHELINSESLRESMGVCEQNIARKKYLWSDIIPLYEKLWGNLYEQSVSYTGDIPVEENPFLNDYLTLFSHYPTSILKNNDICSITPDGIDIIKTGKIPTPYSDISSLLINDMIINILKFLSDKPHTVGEILSMDSLSANNSEKFFTILWMAKYLLINIKKG